MLIILPKKIFFKGFFRLNFTKVIFLLEKSPLRRVVEEADKHILKKLCKTGFFSFVHFTVIIYGAVIGIVAYFSQRKHRDSALVTDGSDSGCLHIEGFNTEGFVEEIFFWHCL